MSFVLPPPRFDDPAVFGRVAVLMGGTSSEREVSLDSGRNVLEALRARGIDANAVDGVPNLIRELRDRQFGHASFDRVFNILHGGAGESGVLQGLLESLEVPYTGSGVLGSALSLDKIRTKQVWSAIGLPTPRFLRIAGSGAGGSDDVHAAARELGLPVIIKPSLEGSSVGISRVYGDADLDAAIELAERYPGELLMEQLIESGEGEGGEYTIGVLDGRALASITTTTPSTSPRTRSTFVPAWTKPARHRRANRPNAHSRRLACADGRAWISCVIATARTGCWKPTPRRA